MRQERVKYYNMFLPLELKIDICELTLAYKRVQTFLCMLEIEHTWQLVWMLKVLIGKEKKTRNEHTPVFHTKQVDEVSPKTEYFQGMHSVAIHLQGLVPWIRHYPVMGADGLV